MNELLPPATPGAPTNAKTLIRSLFLGGVLPVVAFALVEEYYGTMGGLIAGIAFGVGELLYEKIRLGKIQGVTIAGNALVIVLGGVSLLEDDPLFFKLQPAILIFAFSALMIVSSLIKRPFLVEMSKKQMPNAPAIVRERLGALNWRIGICLFAIGLLSMHAAFYWSTAAWAFLKGVGAPVILFGYMAVEFAILRWRAKRRR